MIKTLNEAILRIEELEKENAQLKTILAEYEGKKPAGRKVHGETWTESYKEFVLKYEDGLSMATIIETSNISRRTAYRYKKYYDSVMSEKLKIEIWDCYDRNFRLISDKSLIRGHEASFGPDEFHLVCDISVKHTDGTYLLMRRDVNKKVYPGMWEFTAGGSALKGEGPLECAKRELLEETGIVADDMIEVGRTTVDKNHSHYVVYMANTSCDKESVTLQEGETIDYKWVNKDELLEMRVDICSSRIFNMMSEL